jgi:hypothetical protein
MLLILLMSTLLILLMITQNKFQIWVCLRTITASFYILFLRQQSYNFKAQKLSSNFPSTARMGVWANGLG